MLRPLLLNGLLGGSIAILLVLPPLFHLVTGPLGPLLGGFVAGARMPRRDGTTALGLGLVIGATVAIFSALFMSVILAIVSSFLERGPSNTAAFLLLVPAALGAYAFLMGTLGAFLGMRRRDRKEQLAIRSARHQA